MFKVHHFIEKLQIRLRYLSLKLFTEWSRGEIHQSRLAKFSQLVLNDNPNIQKVCFYFGLSHLYAEYESWHIIGETMEGVPFATSLMGKNSMAPSLNVQDVSYAKVDTLSWELNSPGALVAIYRQDRGEPLVKINYTAMTACPGELDALLNWLTENGTEAFERWLALYREAQQYQSMQMSTK